MRSWKPKNKVMFTELKTPQEQKIACPKLHELCSDDEVDGQEQEFHHDFGLKKRSPEQIEEMCETINHLIIKNKISSKNAFDVPFINLEDLLQFKNLDRSGENGWQKMSFVLENDIKLYLFRIDAVHSITYKILNSMDLSEKEMKNTQALSEMTSISEQKRPQTIHQNIVVNSTNGNGWESLHLQKGKQNIDIKNFEIIPQFDPDFQRTKRKFDQNGFNGMLLNNIELNQNLELSLKKISYQKFMKFYKHDHVLNINLTEQHPRINILSEIEDQRSRVCEIFQQEFHPSLNYERVLQEIKKGNFQLSEQASIDEKNNTLGQGLRSIQKQANQILQRISNLIKNRKKKKNIFHSEADVAKDGISWLSQTDKIILGLIQKSPDPIHTNKNTDIESNRERKDDFNFEENISLQKCIVFSELTIQSQKQFYNQTIEERNLLPLKPLNKFKIEETMSLRSQPSVQEEIKGLVLELKQDEKQIDLKRQQLSIRQNKQTMRSLIKNGTDFSTLCRGFNIEEKQISPELCFLTMLHLANQNNLSLKQNDHKNFTILL